MGWTVVYEADGLGAVPPQPTFGDDMKQELLEMFAGECERLAEEKETEREWLSDYANLVLEEAAKVCDAHAADYSVVGTGMYDSMEHGARTCAAAIREMQAPNVKVSDCPPHETNKE